MDEVKSNRHVPVMLGQVLDGLRLQPGMTVVDGTLGNAGHAQEIVKHIAPGGRLIGLDADPLAIEESTTFLSGLDQVQLYQVKLDLVQDNFSNLLIVLDNLGIQSIDAILLDLGLRRGSLEDSGRGFSFRRGGEPLDMRFNPSDETLTPASEMVNVFAAETLADIFYGYADERLSRRYAKAIVGARSVKTIETVGDLVAVIDAATPLSAKRPGKSSATKVFQALRMAVNQELPRLQQGLDQAVKALHPGGRLAVISFHSIEDRTVKETLRSLASEKTIVLDPKKAIKPSRQEIQTNPLSRSAVLRLATKL